MSELPGTSAVSIESVEWSAESGGNLTVRITGRWRRRRPVSTGQPTLVIEAEGRRHRYPAMPEPPSVGGTGPGVWRLSFTIPGWMAPELGRTWLQFGTVIVPLPVAVPAPGEGALGDRVAPKEPATPPSERPAPASEPAAPSSEPATPPLGSVAPPPGSVAPPPGSVAPPPGSERPPPRASETDPDEPAEPPDFDPTRGVDELAQRVDALEDELRDARAVRDELAASLENRERERRIAEQRAHAERAMRKDLARQLSSSARQADRARQALGELAAAEERIRSLEDELRHARRRSDEAEQVAAAATAARQRAERERELAEQRLQRRAEAGSAEAARLRFEEELRGRHAVQAIRVPAEPPPRMTPVADAAAQAPPDVVARLGAELETRARADAALRARLIDAESRLAARVVLERRTSAALAELRTELDALGGELSRERALRLDAERHAAELERELRDQRIVSLRAYEGIAELREVLVRLATPPEPVPVPEPEPEPVTKPEPAPEAQSLAEPEPAPEPAPPPAAAVEPARLNDALTRLRETIAPHDAPGAPSIASHDAPAAPSTALVRAPSMHEALTRPSVERAFRTMARTDLDAAGRLLLELLPLQRVVYPHAIAYDLVLAPDRCVWVSVPNGTPSIEVQTAPRPRGEVDFQVVGEPARLARLLTAGRLRRLFGRRAARVRGRRQGLVALTSLLGAPLDLGALHRAGVRPDPLIALGLLAAMIDPAWTATERFTLAHATPEASRTYLVVSEGRPLTATRIAPQGGPSTTLHCATDDLLAALAGEPVPGVRVDGEVGAYLSLRKWIKRAQSE